MSAPGEPRLGGTCREPGCFLPAGHPGEHGPSLDEMRGILADREPDVRRISGRLSVRPVTLTEARRFVGEMHRHNLPPQGWLFGVGVEDAAGQLRGVAIAGRPVARAFDDGRTIEVTRTCTDGVENGNSMLYGAIWRAARALGYRRAYTYTLASEPGTSLRAAGWELDAELPPRGGWDNGRVRVETDLFGNARTPTEAKHRWVKIGREHRAA